MIAFSALEQDALTEIFNIGVGIAADALYQIGGEHVPLSVPLVDFSSQSDAKVRYLERETQPLYVIQQNFQGAFSTDALLMFPEENSLELVRLMTGVDMPAQAMSEMIDDAMAEIGNIILNAVISNLSTTLHLPLEGSLPEVRIIQPESLFSNGKSDSLAGATAMPELALMIDFSLHTRNVRGYLAFLLDAQSSEILREHLNRFTSGN